MVQSSVVAVLAVWVFLSGTLILFNARVLQSFKHPVALTCWHQVVGVVMILCVRLAAPSLVATGDAEAGVPPLTLRTGIMLGLPVALCQSVGLVGGNAALLYLSVAFCQMVKAWTPACVYTTGCLMGTQKWSVPILKCIGTITVGLMITSFGELRFNLWGFTLQLLALLSEGLRLNLLELRLKSQGYKLNPLSSMQVFAPMVGLILFVCALLFDRSAFDAEKIAAIGEGVFVANGLVAFLLNIVIYLAIQRASGLTFALAGVIKDILIILGGFFFQAQGISRLQVAGYAIALAGLQAYGVVSKSPESFELGVAWKLIQHALGSEALPPQAKREPQPAVVGAEEDPEAEKLRGSPAKGPPREA